MALNLPFTKKLLKKANPELEELEKLTHLDQETRDTLLKSQAQFDVYATTVNQNLHNIEKAALLDPTAKEQADRLIKHLSNERLAETLDAIESDERVSIKAVKELLNATKEMKNDVTKLDSNIKLSLGDVVKEYQRQIQNENNSTEQQMKVLEGLVSTIDKERKMLKAEIDLYDADERKTLDSATLQKLEGQEALLVRLKEQSEELGKFAKLDKVAFREHSQQVTGLLDKAADETHRSRLLTSLSNVDSQLEQLGIDSRELATVTDKLASQEGDIAGKEDRKRFEDLKQNAKGMAEGAVAFAMEGLGLGEIDKALGLSSKATEMAGKGLRFAAGKMGLGGLVGSGASEEVKASMEYQGTKAALIDAGVTGGMGGGGYGRGYGRGGDDGGKRGKKGRKGRKGRRPRRRGRGKLGALLSLGGLFGGGAMVASGMGGEGSAVDTAMDTAYMAQDAKDVASVGKKGVQKVTEKLGKKGAQKGLTKAASKGGKKVAQKVGGKLLKKVATKGAMKVGGRAVAALGPVGAVAGAGLAGWEIGTLINDYVSKKTGRKDWLFAKLSDRRAKKMEEKRKSGEKAKYAPKFKKITSAAVYNLLGGDEDFDIMKFHKLRTSKAIVAQTQEDGKSIWVTSDEAKKGIGTVSKKASEVKNIEQENIAKKVAKAQASSGEAEAVVNTSGVIQTGLDKAKSTAKAVTEAAPQVMADATTRILEIERQAKDLLAGIAGNTAQTAQAIPQKTEGSSTDRKLQIDDAGLAIIKTVLFG